MPLFLKENQELQDNMYDIPKELEAHLKDTLTQYKDYGTTAAGTMSKGFKRLQSLVDPNYNKQDDNTSEDGHRQISYSDMKRIDHDFRHMSKNPHDLQRVLNGGDEMANWVKSTLDRDRTKVEPVLQQKKVETRNKNAVKPTVAPMKPIEVGNVTANVHENKKTIFISEEQLNVLREYRDQLELPFNGTHTDNLYMRPNYQHYIDFIESIGKYGQLPKSKCDIQKYMNAYFEEAMEDWWEMELDRFNPYELKEYYLDEFYQKYETIWYELFKLSPRQVDEYCEDDDFIYNLFEYYLTPRGEELWQSYLINRFEENLTEYDFPNKLVVNDRGLIYVERTIILPNLTTYDHRSAVYGKSDDLYQQLRKKYDGVGVCWTWALGNGEPYNGSEYGVDNKPTCLTLKGWVPCDSISWGETISMNGGDLAHEREIRMLNGKPIEIFEIRLDDGKKLPLKQPIIVVA